MREPKVFLFDEPLSNLDAALRAQMRLELTELHAKLGATMIYVTHDQVEAMTMADKIVVLNAGRIEQVGSPMDLYNAPATPFVAGFIGSPKMNLFDGNLAKTMGCQTYGIRPEHLIVSRDNGDWQGTVRHIERLGADAIIHMDVPELGALVARRRREPGHRVNAGRQPGCGAGVPVRVDRLPKIGDRTAWFAAVLPSHWVGLRKPFRSS